MNKKNKSKSSCQITFSKAPKSFFKRLVQFSETLQIKKPSLEEIPVTHQQQYRGSNTSLMSNAKKKTHLNLPLKHLLTILEHESSQYRQQ